MVPLHDYHANTERPQTAKKLSILRKYFNVWLTIWSGPRQVVWADKHWCVLDLFAGTGDSHGLGGEVISGSPLVFLEEITKKADSLQKKGVSITLMLFEHNEACCQALQERVEIFLASHQKTASIVIIEIRCQDCNDVVTYRKSFSEVTRNTPAFIFIDPYGMAIRRTTVDTLVSLPWAVDVLFNYMLDGIRRVFGASISDSSGAVSNAAKLAAYFGEDVKINDIGQIADPRTFAQAAFGTHGLLTIAFYMRWPSKSSIQYILLFACRKTTVVNIMREIYAKEMTDQYGQSSLFNTEEYLSHIEVIKS